MFGGRAKRRWRRRGRVIRIRFRRDRLKISRLKWNWTLL
jgi:hypothetical protein